MVEVFLTLDRDAGFQVRNVELVFRTASIVVGGGKITLNSAAGVSGGGMHHHVFYLLSAGIFQSLIKRL